MTQPQQAGRIQVDPAALRVKSSAIGGLPVVNAVLARLGFDELVASYLPEPDPRSRITSTKAIDVLVRNLALGRQLLYGLSAWAAACGAALLGLCDGEARLLNDGRVGRDLDELFSSDRASLLTALSLRAIRRFEIELSELTTTRRRSPCTAPTETHPPWRAPACVHRCLSGGSTTPTAATFCNSGRS